LTREWLCRGAGGVGSSWRMLEAKGQTGQDVHQSSPLGRGEAVENSPLPCQGEGRGGVAFAQRRRTILLPQSKNLLTDSAPLFYAPSRLWPHTRTTLPLTP